MNSCSKWTVVGPSYGLVGSLVSSKYGFLRGFSVSFACTQQQVRCIKHNHTVLCARKGGKGSGRSKKKSTKGKLAEKVVLADSREKAVRVLL